MIRKILAPVRGDGMGGCVLAYATTLALRHGAAVEVSHCLPAPTDMISSGIQIPGFLKAQLLEQANQVAAAEAETLRQQLQHFVTALKIVVSDTADSQQPSAYWTEEVGKMPDVVKRRGRLADLIVAVKPNRDRSLGVNVLQAALFNTGRPVLMCPQISKRPDSLGETVAIAWNGSLEASRAVAMTLDILQRAGSVTILTIGHGAPHGATAEDLVDYLSLRGIEAAINRFETNGRIGDAILSKADEIGADLLIMGAYSDSHEREAIFGGNTQVIVDNAEIPVVMVH